MRGSAVKPSVMVSARFHKWHRNDAASDSGNEESLCDSDSSSLCIQSDDDDDDETDQKEDRDKRAGITPGEGQFLEEKQNKDVVMEQSAEALLSELVDMRAEIQAAIIGLHYDPLVMQPCPCGKGDKQRQFRCYDCVRIDTMCDECIREKHRLCPFHHIEKWTGTYFQRVDLSSTGFVCHLGHRGQPCPSVSRSKTYTVTVCHINGLHESKIAYCGCARKDNEVIQLMRYGLFPASKAQPKTAFTHALLRTFHTDATVSKKSGYDFIQSLCSMTNNAIPISDVFHQFMRVSHFWNVLSAERWSGSFFCLDEKRFRRPKGSYAIPCLACPIPGFNTKEHLSDSYLNAKFMSIDANFHLTGLRKKNKNNQAEKPLWAGHGYLRDAEEVEEHLRSFGDIQEEKSDCSNFLAIQNSIVGNRGKHSGQYASGQVAILCRHGFVVPESVVNLQHGERHINVDLALSGALKSAEGVPRINISYDINCQYSKNLLSRFRRCFSSQLVSIVEHKVKFYIGTFHVVGHKPSCQYGYGLRFAEGTGRTDGEEVERYWSEMNQVAGSTKQMTPGHRSDALDDFNAGWNWTKLRSLCDALYDKHRVAQLEAHRQAEAFKAFDLSIRRNYKSEFVSLWEKESTEPRKDSKGEWTKKPSLHYAASRLQAPKPPRGTGETIERLIYDAIKIEQKQLRYKLKAELVDNSKLDALRAELKQWELTRTHVMPQIRREPADPAADEVMSFVLCLPSTFSTDDRIRLGLQGLADTEYKLRKGQAYDALSNLRNAIRDYEQVNYIKTKFGHGKSAMTRTGNKRKTAADLKHYFKDEYNRARSALLVLDLPHDDKELRDLKDEDMYRQAVQEPHELGSGAKHLGWIWSVGWEDLDATQLSNSLEENRVRWFRARAVKDRWLEEVELLEEESKRLIKGLNSWAELWECHAKLVEEREKGTTCFSAYARSKVHLFNSMESYARSRKLYETETSRPVETMKRSPKRRARRNDEDVERAKINRGTRGGWGRPNLAGNRDKV